MVPLTGILYEFEAQEKVIRDAAAALFEKEGMDCLLYTSSGLVLSSFS